MTLLRHVVCCLIGITATISFSQTLPNPILFCTQVPTPKDTMTVSEVFCNHMADMQSAPRGGDLYIRYTDGSLKNLTDAAGFGVSTGQQGATGIAVRDPSVHWSGTKAIFSMVVGGKSSVADGRSFRWQLYEITGIMQGQTPVITKIENQPASYNNISPIYGTDDRIIFVSDRPRKAEARLYPLFDEYRQFTANTGLWSLNPVTGDLVQLDHCPSGDFTPFIDSYGRLLFTRWDHLQRDALADADVLASAGNGTFNYTDETATGTPQFGVRDEIFPEPQSKRTDLLTGTNMVGFEFNTFFPWQINEDGSRSETINHLGRHEVRFGAGRSINDDPNVVNMNFATSGRQNQNWINNFLYIKEDPNTPGLYYGVDANQDYVHGGGQIVSITMQPTLDPNQSVFTYITDRATAGWTQEGQTPNANHIGFSRNPVPLSDGQLIASHTSNTFMDQNIGTPNHPKSRFAFRLKTFTKTGSYFTPNQYLTSGIIKTLTYWDPDSLVNFSDTLWEMDPVEVRARTIPTRRVEALPTPEEQVFAEEGVDTAKFRQYMIDSSFALLVSRDVTHRDAADHQQPFYLRIAGTTKESPNPTGKVYDVAHLQLLQGDHIRGQGVTAVGVQPKPGRRVIPTVMHDATNLPNPNGPPGSVQLANDASWAAFVPARRAMTWQITDPSGKPVVRERYWVTSKAGEIRVCASCHGTNDEATAPINPIPQNKPEALRLLLRGWKASVLPAAVSLIEPANGTPNVPWYVHLQWSSVPNTMYHIQVATDSTFLSTKVYDDSTSALTADLLYLNANTTFFWRVAASNNYGFGSWSPAWRFTTQSGSMAISLISPPNNEPHAFLTETLRWNALPGAAAYNVQVSTVADFGTSGTLVVNSTDVTDTFALAASLDTVTTYYWRVAPTGGGLTGNWSASWSFTTRGVLAIPPAPVLVSPAPDSSLRRKWNDSTNSIAVQLEWERWLDADSYHVQLNEQGGAMLVDSASLTDNTFTTTLAIDKTYEWRVQSTNSIGTGAWSAMRRFSISLEHSGVGDNPAVPSLSMLRSIAPNPFADATTIAFTLAAPQHVVFKLFNTVGEEIRTISSGHYGAGAHAIVWSDKTLVSGMYYLRMMTAGKTEMRMVEVVR